MFYTYCHTRKDTNKVFYIGKGKDKRAFSSSRKNAYWKSIVEKHGFNAEILAYWNTEQEAFEHEKLLISCFRDMGHKLANMSDGGEGQSGYFHTEESRKKISQKLTGRPKTEEHKKKVIEARKNYIASEETKKKISKTKTGTKISEETKRKMRLAKLGKKHSPEALKKMSDAKKLYYAKQISLNK